MIGLLHRFQAFQSRGAERRRQARFAQSVRHLHGPEQLDGGPQDVVAIALVRNAAGYLDGYFDHYRAMGVRHFAFLDNGSSDDTVARIAAQPGTVVDQCDLPLAEYLDLMRAYPADRYGQNRWCLNVEVDEILDFEGRAQIGINGLVQYLSNQDATAFVTQSLDMFPKTPLGEMGPMTYDDVRDSFIYFDISALEQFDYHSPNIPFASLLAQNELVSDGVPLLFGGIWHKLFGESRCLTRHPLVFNGPRVSMTAHPNAPTGVRCGDVTGVLKNYRFASRTLAQSASVPLFSLDARRWNRVELLTRAGIVTGSDAYRAFLARAAA